MKLLIILFAIIIFSHQTYADDVDTKLDCSHAFTGFEMAECAKIELTGKEQEMNELLDHAIKSFKSSDGHAGIDENQQRMRSTQAEWLKYRNDHCLYDYYSMASIHAPSRDANILYCKVNKTDERIKEIKTIYLHMEDEK